jgi:hypothetical protein
MVRRRYIPCNAEPALEAPDAPDVYRGKRVRMRRWLSVVV